MDPSHYFHWVDYLIFILTVVLSCGMGLYFALKGKRDYTTEEFLMAGRNMSVIPVSVSLFVTYISALTFLGDPVEVYTFGGVYVFMVLGLGLGMIPIGLYIAPYYQKLHLTSTYELLDMKYNYICRIFGSAANLMTMSIWIGMVLYGPAIGLNILSGIPVWICIVSLGLVCTFYTTIGGMKAVIWVDTLQMFFMIAGVIAVIIQGVIKVGGFQEVWRRCDEGGRLNFNNFNPSPLERCTVWTMLIGGCFRTFAAYIGSQCLVQRAALGNFPMFIVMNGLFAILGLVMYAMYHDCDPLLQGRIVSTNQMVPLMVMETLNTMPGLTGLFMACIFSASLSSMSSAFNAMAANSLEDVICPFFKHFYNKEFSQIVKTRILKALVFCCGGLNIGLAFFIMSLDSSLFSLCARALGMFTSPLAAMCFLAIVFPKIKAWQTLVATLSSTALCIWLVIGDFIFPQKHETLPFTTRGCASNFSNQSVYENMTYFETIGSISVTSSPDIVSPDGSFHVTDLYLLSPILFFPLGFCATLLFAALNFWIYRLINMGRTPAEKNELKSNDSYSLNSEEKIKLNQNVKADTC